MTWLSKHCGFQRNSYRSEEKHTTGRICDTSWFRSHEPCLELQTIIPQWQKSLSLALFAMIPPTKYFVLRHWSISYSSTCMQSGIAIQGKYRIMFSWGLSSEKKRKKTSVLGNWPLQRDWFKASLSPLYILSRILFTGQKTSIYKKSNIHTPWFRILDHLRPVDPKFRCN